MLTERSFVALPWQAMAMEMARKGLSIVLISRTESRLNETAHKISQKYPKVLLDRAAETTYLLSHVLGGGRGRGGLGGMALMSACPGAPFRSR